MVEWLRSVWCSVELLTLLGYPRGYPDRMGWRCGLGEGLSQSQNVNYFAYIKQHSFDLGTGIFIKTKNEQGYLITGSAETLDIFSNSKADELRAFLNETNHKNITTASLSCPSS